MNIFMNISGILKDSLSSWSHYDRNRRLTRSVGRFSGSHRLKGKCVECVKPERSFIHDMNAWV